MQTRGVHFSFKKQNKKKRKRLKFRKLFSARRPHPSISRLTTHSRKQWRVNCVFFFSSFSSNCYRKFTNLLVACDWSGVALILWHGGVGVECSNELVVYCCCTKYSCWLSRHLSCVFVCVWCVNVSLSEKIVVRKTAFPLCLCKFKITECAYRCGQCSLCACCVCVCL